ncbi:unnamed protein product, partial [marine sediment metagenome]
ALLAYIPFQKGPVKEHGINGIHNEDLLCIVIDRLESFQKGEYACEENEVALNQLKIALMCLRTRTIRREKTGIEGTSKLSGDGTPLTTEIKVIKVVSGEIGSAGGAIKPLLDPVCGEAQKVADEQKDPLDGIVPFKSPPPAPEA